MEGINELCLDWLYWQSLSLPAVVLVKASNVLNNSYNVGCLFACGIGVFGVQCILLYTEHERCHSNKQVSSLRFIFHRQLKCCSVAWQRGLPRTVRMVCGVIIIKYAFFLTFRQFGFCIRTLAAILVSDYFFLNHHQVNFTTDATDSLPG